VELQPLRKRKAIICLPKSSGAQPRETKAGGLHARSGELIDLTLRILDRFNASNGVDGRGVDHDEVAGKARETTSATADQLSVVEL
jgi:hypothetical protein